MSDTQNNLSPSMEDYLEAIYNLKVRNEIARVKDIAHAMSVKMPSVTGALRTLVEKGLVTHEPYENVELTEKGVDLARAVAHRHGAVREFLITVLGIEPKEAEVEACEIEHAIKPDTLERLLKFVDFVDSVRESDENGALHVEHFKRMLEHGDYPESCKFRSRHGRGGPHRGRFTPAITSMRLGDLSPGAKGRVAFVCGRGRLRKRLMEMGVTPNARFEVVRRAPMGDPVEVKIRDYLLSLRRSEAQHIEVEVD